MEKQFMVLVIRLLTAILAGQNWKTRRSERVIKAADAWVDEREQALGGVPPMDYAEPSKFPRL